MTAATFNFLVSLIEDVVYDKCYTSQNSPAEIINCVMDGFMEYNEQELK